MQAECPHRRFCRLDAILDELSPQAAERFDSLAEPERRRKFDRHARRRRCGDRGRKPGQMVRIDRLSGAIEPGFAAEESEAVCPVSKLCCMRATAACASRFLDRLIRQAPFDIGPVQAGGGSESAAGFETACRRRGIALFALPPRSPK